MYGEQNNLNTNRKLRILLVCLLRMYMYELQEEVTHTLHRKCKRKRNWITQYY